MFNSFVEPEKQLHTYINQKGPERGPEKPREAQRGPERPRQVLKVPEMLREAVFCSVICRVHTYIHSC